MTHTTGPWHRNIKPAVKYPTIFAERGTNVCRLVVDGGVPAKEIEANCDLITAAPEMLRMLRNITNLYEELQGHATAYSQEARAVIAKAEGSAA